MSAKVVRPAPGNHLSKAHLPQPAPTFPTDEDEMLKVAKEWIATLNASVSSKPTLIESLFFKEGFYRDFLILQWDFRTIQGAKQIGLYFAMHRDVIFKVQKDRKVSIHHILGVDTLQVFLECETPIGRGRGMVRLILDSDGKWKGYALFAALHELKRHEEELRSTRPRGVEHGQHIGRKNWKEQRAIQENFEQDDPKVVILGAGQGGLTVAARLGMLKVPCLIVERNPRIGDNWRNRYRSLVLHDPVWYDHMPYMKFPDHYPIFCPKDKLADWFETYASSMELNVWTSTNLDSSHFDEQNQQWTLTVTRSDGSKRTLRPKHVVLASGHSGEPNIPHFPGQEGFQGSYFGHSSKWPGATDGKGKKAIVVGCCNSAHDIAQAYYENGADVTLVQRSSTFVISSDGVTEGFLAGFYEENGPDVEDADVMFFSIPTPLLQSMHVKQTKWLEEKDAAIQSGLTKAGFKINTGYNDSGLTILYFRRGGGYYIDVGASSLIADGKIKVKQGQEIKRVLSNGLEFADGTQIEANEVVLATDKSFIHTSLLIKFTICEYAD